jgi:2-keto-4-pentenoate hydratase
MTPVSHTLEPRSSAHYHEVYVPDQTREGPGSAREMIARRFVNARRDGRALERFPGPLPRTLAESYECQEAAIKLSRDAIVGWKVGLVPPALVATFGVDRLAGPIFKRSVLRPARGEQAEFPVIAGGFAAVEAELVLVIARDAPRDKTDWAIADAFAMVGAMHIGIEIAGSPLSTINELGPLAIVADFGNNAGLIVGPALRGWETRAPEDWQCETFVDGTSRGRGHGGAAPGGPFESLRFLLALSAARARPLKAGDWVSTGALTGVHEIRAGQSARVVFDGAGEIGCRATDFAVVQKPHSDARPW